MPDVNDVLAGRYGLTEVISSGGMATVWRARDEVLARTVAVKILHDHLAQDEAFLARFRLEAVAAAGLTHPHVVSIYDTGEMDAADSICHYIVMEHCGGGTLGTRLSDEGPFSSERTAEVGVTICDALAYAHSKGIVHRDVKPANVLIGDDGLLKVGDFGIAKAVSEKHDITTTGKIMGTVAYISPEYATDRELDARSDIYSLGVVLYELVVGKPPFAEETSVATAMRHVNDPVPPPRSRRAGVARPLEAVIMKALEKDPERRFGSAEEMQHELKALTSRAGDSRVHPPSPSSTQRIQVQEPSSFRAESRWILPVVGLIAGAIVLAAGAAALFGDDPPTSRRPDGSAPATDTEIRLETPVDFDPPPGDGTEDSSGLVEAIDGDPSTSWKTDSYQNPLSTYKPGVGIMFDLGEETEVTKVAVVTPDQDLDLQLLAGQDPPSEPNDLEVLEEAKGASGTITFEPSTSARYWVVWITDLPGGAGGLAQISEVRFFGR